MIWLRSFNQKNDTVPLNYWGAYTHDMVSTYNTNWNVVEYKTRIGTVDGSTDTDWEFLKLILTGIKALYDAADESHPDPSEPSTYGLIARVEFFSVQQGRATKRGAVLFDNYGAPILHAFNALLGYGGAGPQLSGQILSAIGVLQSDFEDANKMVESGNYDALIFSREHHEVVEGVDTAFPYAPVEEAWSWWITSS